MKENKKLRCRVHLIIFLKKINSFVDLPISISSDVSQGYILGLILFGTTSDVERYTYLFRVPDRQTDRKTDKQAGSQADR